MNERPNTNNAQHSIRRHLAIGVTTVGFLVGGVGGWAVTTELSGAVIAPGLLVVESDVKKVQHPTGGVDRRLRRPHALAAAGRVALGPRSGGH